MEGVELAMALEEALASGDRSVAALQPYLVDPPVFATCVKGGFEFEVVVYARHGKAVFFVSGEADQFGMGTVNEFGDVVESNHYPTLSMALRAFAGAIKRSTQ